MNPEPIDSESASQHNASKKLTRKRIGLIIVGIIVLGAVGLLAAKQFVQHQNKTANKNNVLDRGKPNPKSGEKVEAPLLEPSKPDGEFANLIYEADKLAAIPDRESAIKKLEAYMPKAKGADQEFAVASRLCTLYFGLSNWQQALNWGERAQQTNQPGVSSLNLTMGMAAEKLGNKPKAVTAYKAYLETIKNEKGSAFDSQRQQYQNKIKALGG